MTKEWSIPRIRGALLKGVEHLRRGDGRRWRCRIPLESPRTITVFDAVRKESYLLWVLDPQEFVLAPNAQAELVRECVDRGVRRVAAANGSAVYLLRVDPGNERATVYDVIHVGDRKSGGAPAAVARALEKMADDGWDSEAEEVSGASVFARLFALYEAGSRSIGTEAERRGWPQRFFEAAHHRIFQTPFSAGGLEETFGQEVRAPGLAASFERLVTEIAGEMGRAPQPEILSDYLRRFDGYFSAPEEVDEAALDWMLRYSARQGKEAVWAARPEHRGVIEAVYRQLEAQDPTLKPQEILDRVTPPQESSLMMTRDLLALASQGKPVKALSRPFERTRTPAKADVVLNPSVQWRPKKWLIALRKFSDPRSRWALRVTPGSLRDPSFQEYLLSHFLVKGVFSTPNADASRPNSVTLFLERADGEFLAPQREANFVPFVRFKRPMAELIPPRSRHWQDEALRLKELDYWQRRIQLKREPFEDNSICVYPLLQKELYETGFSPDRKRYEGRNWMWYLRAEIACVVSVEDEHGIWAPLSRFARVTPGESSEEETLDENELFVAKIVAGGALFHPAARGAGYRILLREDGLSREAALTLWNSPLVRNVLELQLGSPGQVQSAVALERLRVPDPARLPQSLGAALAELEARMNSVVILESENNARPAAELYRAFDERLNATLFHWPENVLDAAYQPRETRPSRRAPSRTVQRSNAPVIRLVEGTESRLPAVLRLVSSRAPRIYESFGHYLVCVEGKTLPMGRWKDVEEFLAHYDSGVRRFRVRRVAPTL